MHRLARGPSGLRSPALSLRHRVHCSNISVACSAPDANDGNEYICIVQEKIWEETSTIHWAQAGHSGATAGDM